MPSKLAESSPTDGPDRDLRIDLFRGLSLWLIYIDHIPSDFLSRITPRNFGFSDAAELFIFLSGLTCGHVYGNLALQRGFMTASAHILRRTWQIYVATIFLFAAYAAEVFVLAHGRDGLLDGANIAVFLRDPGMALLELLALRYVPVNMDALPLIIVLHLALPLVLLGLLTLPRLALATSLLLYILAHHFDWSISAYPRGTIYFNPLDWQLLFVIGAWIGLDGLRSIRPLLQSRWVVAICVVYVVISLIIVIGWQIPALQVPLPEFLTRSIYPVDKSDLDLLRLLHFLALAIVIWRIIPTNLTLPRSRAVRPIIRCGEYSLVLFCLGVLLAFAAGYVLTDVSSGFVAQFLVGVLGIAIMIGAATLLSKADRQSSDQHPRTI